MNCIPQGGIGSEYVSEEEFQNIPDIDCIYTDGSCNPNPGPGGWGAIIRCTNGTTQEMGGYEAQSTNQRMEVRALIEAIKIATENQSSASIPTIYSDSRYAINAAQSWVKRWKQQGWRKADGSPIQNLDLMQELAALLPARVQFKWVKGHTGNAGNEAADRLANEYRLKGIQAQSNHQACTGLDWLLADTRTSGIPDVLATQNISWVEGEDALDALAGPKLASLGAHSQQYTTKSTQRVLDRYQFAEAGGWVAYGCTIDGEEENVAYFKPLQPRNKTELDLDYSGPRRLTSDGFGQRPIVLDDRGKPKKIKYETPQGCAGLPLLAWVPDEVAQATWKRFNVTPNNSLSYWQNVIELDFAVAVVEGFKKALALIAQGIPAIALRGVSMWHQKGSRELHDVLKAFATPKRTIYVCFDQDSNTKTVRNVRREALSLGSELDKLGCKVELPIWDGQQYGKGIDDVLFGAWPGREQWFANLLGHALSLKQYRRHGLIAKAFAKLAQLERLSYTVERTTAGNYLPQLSTIEVGAIHLVKAGLGAGKTYRIGRDWVAEAHGMGWFTIVLSPMNPLGQQTAERWKLPHIHENYDKAFWERALGDGGVVLCADSLDKLPNIDKPILLVLDEANQVIDGLASAGTLGDRQSMIVQIFEQFAGQAAREGAIVLSEDGIADRAVRFMRQMSGAEQVRVFEHTRIQKPWNCTMYTGQISGYRQLVMSAVADGRRIIYVTASQREGKRLEKAIEAVYPDKTVIRLDSETNAGGQRFSGFFKDPNAWVIGNNPDVLILSPSAKSGISIEVEHFEAVYGYFPALAGDTHWQLLGRYRQPVPRHIFVPPFINSSADESLMSPRRAKQRYQTYSKQMAGAFGIDELLTTDPDDAERIIRIETALIDYHATQRAVQGAMKAIAYDYLKDRLDRAGHNVVEVKCSLDRDVSQLWKGIQEQIWREDAELIAIQAIQDKHDADWARLTLASPRASYPAKVKARKVFWRLDFPGIDFDEPEECYEALCLDHGAMRRGVLLQAAAENVDATKKLEKERATKVLGQTIRAIYRLPRNLARASIISQSGILEVLDGREYSNNCELAQEIKARAIANSEAIWEYLGLKIRAEQTPSEITNKLLRKLGLEIDKADRIGAVKRLRREGARGHQIWIYAVDLNYSPTRVQLMKAAQRKLLRVGSHDSEIDNPMIKEIMTTPPQPPQNQEVGWPPGLIEGWANALLACQNWEQVENATQSMTHKQKQSLWDQLKGGAARLHVNELKREAMAA